jgi:branched-chain amino acid transport system substrate-binding protein
MNISRRLLLSSAVFSPFVRASSALAASPAKIGLFVPLSGFAAPSGAEIRDAVTLFVKEKNAAGGVLGAPIDLIVADDAGKPEEAVNIARRFATRDDVLVAVGSVTSPTSLAAAQVFREAQIPQVVVTSTAQRITTQGNEWIFRSAAPDTKLVADLVDFIVTKSPNLKRFALLYVNDDFGKGGIDNFKAAGEARGLTIVAEERIATGDLDFSGQLTRIRDAKPDALLDWTRYTEASLIARQLQQLNMGSLPHFGSDSFAVPKYIELSGAASNGVMYPSPFSSAVSTQIPAAQTLEQKLKAAYGKPTSYNHVQGWDAIYIAVDSIARAGKPDRTAIRDAMRVTKFDSARGAFSFDKKGDPTFETAIIRVVDQKETNARL